MGVLPAINTTAKASNAINTNKFKGETSWQHLEI